MEKVDKAKNFRDPVGLLFRMLASGDATAYAVLLREFLPYLLSPLDKRWQRREKGIYDQKLRSSKPLILVLGGSRSGTTLLYQVLARTLSVSYFTNLGQSFPRAPITMAQRWNKYGSRHRSSRYRNYYGSVAGLHSPSDGFHIWNRWFGTDRNHAPDRLEPNAIQALGHFIHAWHETIGLPLLNKNNRNAYCIEHFEQAYPDRSYYILIERDPIYVAQSLLLARETVQGHRSRPWGLGATTQDTFDSPAEEILSVCRQVDRVNDDIRTRLETIPESRKIMIRYEDFCQDPGEHIRAIADQITGCEMAMNLEAIPKELTSTNRRRMKDSEFALIKRFFDQKIPLENGYA